MQRVSRCVIDREPGPLIRLEYVLEDPSAFLGVDLAVVDVGQAGVEFFVDHHFHGGSGLLTLLPFENQQLSLQLVE